MEKDPVRLKDPKVLLGEDLLEGVDGPSLNSEVPLHDGGPIAKVRLGLEGQPPRRLLVPLEVLIVEVPAVLDELRGDLEVHEVLLDLEEMLMITRNFIPIRNLREFSGLQVPEALDARVIVPRSTRSMC